MKKRKIPFGFPIVNNSEIKQVTDVLKGNVFAHGPKNTKFENDFSKYTGAPYSVSVSSCTAGMHLIYFALGIGDGDEVIVPSQTHVATVHAVELTGAKPIFIDSDSTTGNINIDLIEKNITKKTKAICVVHYLGLPTDLIKLNKIAKKYKLYVIEDCALSLGAKINKIHTGLLGYAGAFSFYPVKHITTGEGGMVITKDKKLAKKIRLIRGLGVDKSFHERKVPGIYDVISLGFNYRMNEFQASIGIEQLKKLPSFLKIRKRNFNYLRKELNRIDYIDVLPGKIDKLKGSYYCLLVILKSKLKKNRKKIINNLNKIGIGTSIYYPQPVPRMTYYKKKYNYKVKNFVNSIKFSDNSIALPIGPHINLKDCEYISKNFKNIVNKLTK